MSVGVCAVVMMMMIANAGCQREKKLPRWTQPADQVFHDPEVLKLVIAAEKGDIATLQQMIQDGVDVNAQGANGETPLLRSIYAKNRASFKLLLDHGANPNVKTEYGWSVMEEAADAIADAWWLKTAMSHGGE